ncbi:uncharacterized protein DUF4279 [Kineococcus xinjiangensis]|uniref:Uncharacterized protein DUF4279 n=1 Tax=Kineococcus xinjiangensis TaxID=512762 RepID=A0A2S6IEC3_9ACTN|nr:DUF4279 domain-containing protein [Kineococcus xinjiangensis]PPK92574.1 uncharacterized protein DUF4279 [Kineococcus xinjiangensis]
MVTFRLVGESGGSARAVTDRLGITPTGAVEVGHPIGTRRPDRLYEQSGWWLSSATSPEDGVELAEALHRVLNQLEPVAPLLWELVEQGYWANWFCHVGSHATEHAVELDRAFLTRLLGLPGELWLDIYGDDDEERSQRRGQYT